jgi:hypothetical protein
VVIAAASANAPTIAHWPAYPLNQVLVSTYQIPYVVIFSSRQRQSLRFSFFDIELFTFRLRQKYGKFEPVKFVDGCEDS